MKRYETITCSACGERTFFSKGKGPDNSCPLCATPFTDFPPAVPRTVELEESLTAERWADLVACGSTAKEADARRWRYSIVRTLVDDGGVGPDEAEFLALTVVGMFDAGASDAEVSAFLASALPTTGSVDSELVTRMHRSVNQAHGHRGV